MRTLRRTFLSIIWIPESASRTALAFSIGVFWGFSPLLGLHTLIGLATALVFRLNKVALLAGVWSNLPWLLPFYYGVATWVGIHLTGVSTVGELPAVGISRLIDPAFWGWIASQWRLFYPAFIGSTVLSLILAILAYPTALIGIRHFRKLNRPEFLAPDPELRGPAGRR